MMSGYFTPELLICCLNQEEFFHVRKEHGTVYRHAIAFLSSEPHLEFYFKFTFRTIFVGLC